MTPNLNIVARADSGKRNVRKLRHDGFVPGVIYGDNKEPVLVSIGEKELLSQCYTLSFLGRVLEMKVGSSTEKFLPKSIAFHPVTSIPLHVDFQRISKNAKVKITLSIAFTNREKSPGLKKGGFMNVVIHKLDCYCSPESIPEKILVDLTGKNIGENILACDLKLPDGVEPVSIADSAVIANITGARVVATASSGEEKPEDEESKEADSE